MTQNGVKYFGVHTMKMEQGGGAAAATRSREAEPLVEEFGKLTFHPLVMAFPRLEGEQLDQLAEEIRSRGGSGPILKRGEVILDDFNRVEACRRAGIALSFREWDGSGSLAMTIARAILPRTHLTESQRAAIAVPISDQLAEETIPARHSPLKRGSQTGNQNLAKVAFLENPPVSAKMQQRGMSESCYDFSTSESRKNGAVSGDDESGGEAGEQRIDGRAAAIAAELCQVSVRYVFHARKLRDENRALFEQVRSGLINLSKARVAASKLLREKSLTRAKPIRPQGLISGDEMIVGDCLEKMARLGDGAFDLIFADPPYNLGWTYDADPTGDLLPEPRYLEWTERWIKHCARLLSPRGSMFVMISARWQGRFDVILRNCGLFHRSTIVWHDRFPNNTDANFQPAARFIHYFTRSPKHFTWDGDAIRVPSRRDEIQDARRTHDKGIVPHDVWDDIYRVVGNAKDRVPFDDAPPQVPAGILKRIILAASNEGDRVFDPFTGNGTTWREARLFGRKFTGIERSAKYAAQARQWAEGGA